VRFAQIAFSLPGRRSARLRPGRGVVSPLVFRLLPRSFRRKARGRGRRRKRGDREGWTSDTGERKIKWLDFRTTGMDTGAPESGYRERSKFRRATSREGGGERQRGMVVRQEETAKIGGLREARERRKGNARRRMAEETISAPMTKGGEEGGTGFPRGCRRKAAGGGANLTFISGIVGFAPRGTLSRGGSRARDRDEYERGWATSAEGVRKLPRILHPVWRVRRFWSLFPPASSGPVQLGKLCLDTPEGRIVERARRRAT